MIRIDMCVRDYGCWVPRNQENALIVNRRPALGREVTSIRLHHNQSLVFGFSTFRVVVLASPSFPSSHHTTVTVISSL